MGMILDKAIIFAVGAHNGMVRKGTETPYILHPMETAAIVGTITDDEEVIAAAVLHDVIEDTPMTPGLLREEFGERILSLVAAETEDKRRERPPVETWKLRKREAVDALSHETRLSVKAIALGDKLSNMRAIYGEYRQCGDRLWDKFNQKDKAEHGWYYRSVADATKELAAFPAWQEFDQLIKAVFNH